MVYETARLTVIKTVKPFYYTNVTIQVKNLRYSIWSGIIINHLTSIYTDLTQ